MPGRINVLTGAGENFAGYWNSHAGGVGSATKKAHLRGSKECIELVEAYWANLVLYDLFTDVYKLHV